ncbi:MAG: 16S rRNA (guanine(966)-N(2))-methyltransferase RsmD [Actinophytocola sp.]|nr:16S rRNA (guanine(966)-N(2))-methyltransferase RsmD [Actinophytocola sp.]
MTRIVAGSAGGRRLRVPPRGTRPTAERVREALFNALDAAGDVEGARVLDLYSGSGALGLEALSRGAADAYFVESDRRAVEVLRGNVDALGIGGTVRHGVVTTVLAEPAPAAFQLVIADPPYAVTGEELHTALTAMADNGWLAPEALVVIERECNSGEIDWPAGFRPLRSRRYGQSVLHRAEYRPVA